VAGFGLGGLLIAVDEMLKGFSLRAFSAATAGLLLGTGIAWMVDRSQLFRAASADAQWLLRLCCFLGFGYIGMVLAMRSNKEDFSLIIPYVRFKSESQPDHLLLLDTSVIIDGRIADLIEARVVDGVVVVPRFVLRELQALADSSEDIKRTRGRRGLQILNQIRRNAHAAVKIHEADFPEEKETDAKLLRLARSIGAKLYTNDHNLGEIADLQSIPCVNLHKVALALKPAVLPGDMLTVALKREGKERGQAVGYLNDGTMVVVNDAREWIGKTVQAEVQTLLQTGMGVIIFAQAKVPASAAA
jgi:uncharacterized protein YacL